MIFIFFMKKNARLNLPVIYWTNAVTSLVAIVLNTFSMHFLVRHVQKLVVSHKQ